MSTNLRILVADDDQAVVWLWARILQWGFGAEVVAVFDGTTAVSRVVEGGFDLVITDLQMPGASGFDVLRCAKMHDAAVPVILSTGHAAEGVVTAAMRLGASAVLQKPFDLDAAVGVAREVLNRTSSRATARGFSVTTPGTREHEEGT